MTSIRPVSSIWCSICPTNAVSFQNLHLETDSQIRQPSGRWGRRTAYVDIYSIDEWFLDFTGFRDRVAHAKAIHRDVLLWATGINSEGCSQRRRCI